MAYPKDMTLVTRPQLPPLDEYIEFLKEIWESQHLTNNGPLHNQLEDELKKHLNVEHISLFNNGTSALIAALGVSSLRGEVITTPFSFLATSHSILWNNLTPVFVDIEPNGFNIDPAQVEKAVTTKTSAVLGVHCYGHPCNNKRLEAICQKNGLRLIYDAAHAFDVKSQGKSILNFGDLSALSFHATKVFNTFEGGAVVCHSADMKEKLDQYKNFGLNSLGDAPQIGINGKMSEPCAAMGLALLKYRNTSLEKSSQIHRFYTDSLSKINGVRLIPYADDLEPNYSYFPIVLESNYSVNRDQLLDLLFEEKIFAKKYFSPSLTQISSYKDRFRVYGSTNIADKMTERVLCLPMYPDLPTGEAKRIIEVIERMGADT